MISLKQKYKTSIKFRSILIVAVIVTIVQLISTVLLVRSDSKTLMRSFHQRIDLLTKIQADALSIPMWDFNNDTIISTLAGLQKDQDFVYAEIRDTENKVIYSVGNPPLNNDSIIEVIEPIIYIQKEKSLGKLRFVVSAKDLQNKLAISIFFRILNFIILQAFILGATYIVFSDLINPILLITQIVNLIKDNRLDNVVPETTRVDEIGAIANAVNSLQISTKNINEYRNQKEKEKEARDNKISQLIEEFSNEASQIVSSVQQASKDLEYTAKQMSDIIKNVDYRTLNVSSISSRTSENIANVTSSTGGMNNAIEEITLQIAKSSSIVFESVQKTEKARNTTDSLDKAMSQIGEVVSFIGSIAKQVNMLALNATIESARAGEAGKGFAVVASEVKNLAHQTSSATEDIRNKIANIKTASDEVLKVMLVIKESINKVNEYSTAVASAVEEQHIVTKDIFANMKIATDGAKEISSNINDIKSLTSNADNSTQNVLTAAGELSQQADLISSLVNKFSKDIKNI